MKKLLMLAVAGMFSVGMFSVGSAYACDGMKKAKAEKAGTVAKSDKKPDATKKDDKKS